jgi:hypothetical protein
VEKDGKVSKTVLLGVGCALGVRGKDGVEFGLVEGLFWNTFD